MFRKLLIVTLLLPVALSAQGQGGSSGSPEPHAPSTPLEHIIDKLGLDSKTQVPEVQKIFQAAATPGAAIGAEMASLRRKMLDLYVDDKASDVAPILASYTESAIKMTGLEAETFGKVFALLKPNQQSKTAKAFPYMAGYFTPQAPRGRGARRGGVE